VPFIVAKTIKPFVGEPAESFATSPATLLLGASLLLAAIPVIGYVLSSFLNRKHEADLVAALEKARERRVATAASKKAAAAAPAPPTAPPPTAPPPTEVAPGPAAGAAPPSPPPAGPTEPPKV
ncbi:MAG: hypothetical protein ACAI25_09775, partial [Planctomycetota bacterium]